MEPTYALGHRVLIAKTGGEKTRRGDVVLFSLPGRYQGKAVMQRVIGLGGDHVIFDGTRLTVNGTPLKELYLKGSEVDGGHGPYDVKVPAGRMFLLGDNRGNANDSRYFSGEDAGTVPVTAVRGRALDDATVPTVLGLGALLGVVLALAGAVCALVGGLTRRRRATVPPPFTGYAGAGYPAPGVLRPSSAPDARRHVTPGPQRSAPRTAAPRRRAPHYYDTEDEVDAVTDTVTELARRHPAGI